MKTTFQRIFESHPLYEIKIPTTFFERLRGIKKFKWFPATSALAFRSPCILHTFGLKQDLWIVPLDKYFRALSSPYRCPPNTLAFPAKQAQWLAELTESPALHSVPTNASESKPLLKRYTLSQRAISMFRTFALFIIGLSLSLCMEARAIAAKGPFRLPVGESKEVSLAEPPKSLDISHPDVIDVQRIGLTNKILVTALRSGNSRLTAYFPTGSAQTWDFQVGVTSQIQDVSPSLSSGSLIRLARDIQRRAGLETVLDNGRVVVFGHAQNEAQFSALSELCLGRDECLPRYTTAPAVQQSQARFLRALCQESGLHGINIDTSVGGIIARGSVENESQLEQIKLYLRSVLNRHVESIVVDKSSNALIEVELVFFRMNLSQLNALGLATQAPTNEPGDELIRAQVPNLLSQIVSGPRLQFNFPNLLLKALSQKGVMQQIAKPSIVVASGGKGEIQTGGELLFQSRGTSQKFFAQNYGLIVTVQPTLNSSGRILNKVEIKMSNPQSSPNPNALSSMDQSLLSTELSSRSDEQILLTRINQQINSKLVTKIPLLGHIPILGELFKSRDMQSEDTELWITLKSSLERTVTPQKPETSDSLKDQTPHAHWLD